MLISRVSFYNTLSYRYKEAPPQSIIENDYALDRWILEQQAKERSERAKNATSTDDKKKRGPRDAKDEFDSSQIIQ